MSPMGTNDFMNDNKFSGNIVDWKKDGKITIFIHPRGFEKRRVIWFPQITESKKKGKSTSEFSKIPVVTPGIEKGCPISELVQYLRENDDIESDEVIFSFPDNKKSVEMTKGDILNEEGFDWKLSLVPAKEYVFGCVDVDNVEAGVQTMIAGPGMSRAMTKCIKNQIDEDGEDKGDPLKNPWAMKLEFDDDESPNRKYSAYYSKAEITDEIKELLDGEEPDFNGLVKPLKPKEIWAMMEDYLQIKWKPSLLDSNDNDDEEEKTEKKKVKDEEEEEKEEKVERKKKIKEEEEEEEKVEKKKKVKDEDEDKDEEKAEKKKKVKKEEDEEEEKVEKKSKKSEEETEPCPQCGEPLGLSEVKCPHCKTEFQFDGEEEEEKKEEKEEKKESKKKSDDDDEKKDDDNNDEDTLTCDSCGETGIPQGKKRCPECGEKL